MRKELFNDGRQGKHTPVIKVTAHNLQADRSAIICESNRNGGGG